MINLISQDLPETVIVEGEEYEIHTDFKYWLNYIALAKDEELTPLITLELMLFLYIDEIPGDIEKAIAGLNTFLQGAIYKQTFETTPRKSLNVEVIDYTRDSGLILGAFLETYNINLLEVEMHWWVFTALLSSVNKDTTLAQIMSYRTIDTSKLKGEQKSFYDRMKKQHALNTPKPLTSKAERERDIIERLKKRKN